MINAKLENAVAIGPHLVEMRQAGGDERSSGKGKQRDAASGPAFRLPETGCHGYPYCGHHFVSNQIPQTEPALTSQVAHLAAQTRRLSPEPSTLPEAPGSETQLDTTTVPVL